MSGLDVDWFEHAVMVLAKKKGLNQLSDPQDYQKYYRFYAATGLFC
ncbi:MAG: hypothetical protein NWQ26_03165 [Paraglaciecola sp.]|nr:hypothetical protein [Paraglaciecola sp.]